MKTILLCFCLLLQDPSVADLIEKLRSDDVAIRNQAALALRKMGTTAVPALERAAEDKDQEVAGRVREILRTIKTEEVIGTVRQKLKNADTASILVKTSSTTFIGNVLNEETGAITLQMKAKNRVYFNARVFGLNSHIVLSLVSDGTKVWTKWPEKSWEEHEAPADLNAKLADVLLHTGCTHPFDTGYYMLSTAQDKSFISPLKISKPMVSSDKDKLSLTFVLENESGSRDVTQSFDPATFSLLKARSAAQNPKVRGTSEAIFQKWELNRDIPEGSFSRPEIGKTEEDLRDAAKKTLRTLRQKLLAYDEDIDGFPTTEQGLQALLEKPTKNPVPKDWKGPYLTDGTLLRDPWGNPYVYRFPGKRRPSTFDLSCAGPDGKLGTDDDLY